MLLTVTRIVLISCWHKTRSRMPLKTSTKDVAPRRTSWTTCTSGSTVAMSTSSRGTLARKWPTKPQPLWVLGRMPWPSLMMSPRMWAPITPLARSRWDPWTTVRLSIRGRSSWSWATRTLTPWRSCPLLAALWPHTASHCSRGIASRTSSRQLGRSSRLVTTPTCSQRLAPNSRCCCRMRTSTTITKFEWQQMITLEFKRTKTKTTLSHQRTYLKTKPKRSHSWHQAPLTSTFNRVLTSSHFQVVTCPLKWNQENQPCLILRLRLLILIPQSTRILSRIVSYLKSN